MTDNKTKNEILEFELALKLSQSDFMRLLYSNQSRCKKSNFRRYFYDWNSESLHPDYNFVISILYGEDGSFVDISAWINKEHIINNTDSADDNFSNKNISCDNILNGFGRYVKNEDGSHGIFRIEARISDKDTLQSIISGKMSESVSHGVLGTATSLYLIACIETTRRILTTPSGLIIVADSNEYAGASWNEVSFRYGTEAQKKSFLKYLNGRKITHKPLVQTAYSRVVKQNVKADQRQKSEAGTQKNEAKAQYESEILRLKSDISYLCEIIKNADDIASAQKEMQKYLLFGKQIHQERNVPVGFSERAIFLLQNYKEDAARVALCDKRNIDGGEFVYYGITKREYTNIKSDHKMLEDFFSTSLIDHKDIFERLFKAGLSYMEYAKEYLPTKTKKAGVCAAQRVHKALAAEIERIQKAETLATVGGEE